MIKINDTQTFKLVKVHSLCFVGKEAFFSPERLDWLFMPTKLAWGAEKRGFRKMKIRKGSAFVHEAHKLVPKHKKLCLLSAHWNAAGRIPPQGYWLGGDHYNWFNWFCILVDLGYFLSVLLWKYSLRETLHCQRLFGGEERTDALAHIHTSWAALTGWQLP